MIAAFVVLWSTGEARAASVSLDVDRAMTLYDGGRIEATSGGGRAFVFEGPSSEPAAWTRLRIGHEVGLPMLRVTPELSLGGVVHGTSWYDRTPSTELRATGGLRLGLGGPVRPGVYGHIGWGWGRYTPSGGGDRTWESAVTLDAGGYLEVAVSRLRLGGHAGYSLFPAYWGNAHTVLAGGTVGVAF